MKTYFSWMLLAVLAVSGIGTVWAAPERLSLKEPAKRVKERAAKAQIKGMDLQNIEDPEARRAIREILNYLNLQARQ